MGEQLLVTSGDTIKLWDASTYAFCEEIPSHTGPVSRLAWNQDGQCLASLSDSGKEIHFSAVCSKSGAKIGVVRGIESPTCLDFACRSPHYLGVGSATGLVTIWNVKSQAQKKVFTPTDRAITSISFSHSDSHIAAATKKGTLYMLSVSNNLTVGPYELFHNQVVTDLSYSRVKKSLLGCSSEGGTVALYDTHANKLVHSFPSAHSSPVAGIAFSPVNELLMVSVGYDKKLSCFNVQTRQPVMTHRSSAPLTSITFLGMGQLVALGSLTGQVFIHDMRTINTPLATLKAHKTAVTNVLLQPYSKSKSVSCSKTGQRSSTAPSLSVASQRSVKSCSDQPNEVPVLRSKPDPSLEATNFHDLSVFSPIRETTVPSEVQTSEGNGFDNLPSFQVDIPMESVLSQSLFSPIRTTDLHHNHYSPLSQHMDINEDNLLSPIRDTAIITRSDSVNSESPSLEVKSPLSMDISLTSPTAVTDKENIEPLPAVTKEHSSTTQPPDNKPTLPTINTPSTLEERSKGINSSTWTSPAPPLSVSFASPSKSSPPKKRPMLRPLRTSDLAPGTPPTQHEIGGGAAVVPSPARYTSDMPAATHAVPQLQMELVRSCMVDVLEEFQDDINSRLMHLQYIITKKFIQQEEVMEKMHRQYSLNEELMEENEKLRQQIAKLQAKY